MSLKIPKDKIQINENNNFILYVSHEVAKRLNVTRATVNTYVKDGYLDCFELSMTQRFFTEGMIQDCIKYLNKDRENKEMKEVNNDPTK
jgi:DNA-binding transcriptional MerR regulator